MGWISFVLGMVVGFILLWVVSMFLYLIKHYIKTKGEE